MESDDIFLFFLIFVHFLTKKKFDFFFWKVFFSGKQEKIQKSKKTQKKKNPDRNFKKKKICEKKNRKPFFSKNRPKMLKKEIYHQIWGSTNIRGVNFKKLVFPKILRPPVCFAGKENRGS